MSTRTQKQTSLKCHRQGHVLFVFMFNEKNLMKILIHKKKKTLTYLIELKNDQFYQH